MKKYYKTGLFILCLLFSAVGCSKNDESNSANGHKNDKTKQFQESPVDKYKEIVETAKANGAKTNIDFSKIAEDEIALVEKFYDSVESYSDMEAKTDIGIQGVVISSNPYFSIEEENYQGPALNKLTVYVNKVLYGNSNLEGKEVVIIQFGGFTTPRLVGIGEKFELSEEAADVPFFQQHDETDLLQTGDELIGYIALDEETPEKLDLSYECYQFYAGDTTRFDYNEETDQYEQALTETYREEDEEDLKELIEEGEKLNIDVNEKLEEVSD